MLNDRNLSFIIYWIHSVEYILFDKESSFIMIRNRVNDWNIKY